jgi:hypothetical protein
MTDDIQSTTAEHLRLFRAELADQGRFLRELRDETRLQTQQLTLMVKLYAGMAERLDGFDTRLDRIEKVLALHQAG